METKILSADQIRDKMIIHNLTQSQLADKVNCTRASLSLYLNGKLKRSKIGRRVSLYFGALEARQ